MNWLPCVGDVDVRLSKSERAALADFVDDVYFVLARGVSDVAHDGGLIYLGKSLWLHVQPRGEA